jgi:hypothetical protein
VLFTCLGLPLARRVNLAGVPPLSVAPALGWAVFSVLALPVFSLTGFSTAAVTLYAAVLIAAAYGLHRRGRTQLPAPMAKIFPLWAMGLAAAMGVLPIAAVMPKFVADGVLLAPPIFDHVKIALVDAILRDGLPVSNPFYGPQDPGQIVYYYLWHFGTAVVARLLRGGGWQAEAAMTGFTAMSSVMLMSGLAMALGGRAIAIASTSALSIAGSLRPLLAVAFGQAGADAIIPGASDIGTWLNQAAWVPQHMASATCALLSALLMLNLAGGGWVGAVCLGLTVAASFESSIWVGGIAFAAIGSTLGVWCLWSSPRHRLRLLGRGVAAACLAALLITPLAFAELHGLAARHGGAGLAIMPYAVLGNAIGPAWQTALNAPAFWLLFLPFAFPALIPLGTLALLRPRPGTATQKTMATALCLTAFACLAVVWLVRSTLDNNDLGWRAAIPATLALAPAAACLTERLMAERALALVVCAVIAALGLPQTFVFARDYTLGQRPGDPAGFAHSEALWQDVQRLAGPDERIANSPLAIQAATPWPVNIGWALLANRPSCYAGWETVLAYATVSRARLEAISARFGRVFDGRPGPGDVQALAGKDNCRLAVVTPADGAWIADPFAAGPLYRLIAGAPGWRIYRRVSLTETAPADAAATSAPQAAPSVPAVRPGPPSPPAP